MVNTLFVFAFLLGWFRRSWRDYISSGKIAMREARR
jgi:hypothetical protein